VQLFGITLIQLLLYLVESFENNDSCDHHKEMAFCCRGDDGDAESSDGDDPGKPIPEWARGRALMQQLASQVQTDPDEVFQQHRKTCSLDEVFGHSGESAIRGVA